MNSVCKWIAELTLWILYINHYSESSVCAGNQAILQKKIANISWSSNLWTVGQKQVSILFWPIKIFNGSLLYFQSSPPPHQLIWQCPPTTVLPILVTNQALFPFLQPIRHCLPTSFPHSYRPFGNVPPLLSYSCSQSGNCLPSYNQSGTVSLLPFTIPTDHLAMSPVPRRLFFTALQWIAIAQGPKIQQKNKL